MRRGLSTLDLVTIGDVNMTAPRGTAVAGDADGRPLSGACPTIDKYDPNPGRTKISNDGRISTDFYPPPNPGGHWPLELRFTRFDAVAHLAALQALFATGAAFDVRIPLEDGRVWVGRAKPDRRDGKVPVEEETGDHPHDGGHGRELVVRLLSTEGGFE